ncbi:unnamed protein product, partial [Didymodactylos carnosus]
VQSMTNVSTCALGQAFRSDIISSQNKTSLRAPIGYPAPPSIYHFWRRYLRKTWHYLVVPPLIAEAKRLQRGATSREDNQHNQNSHHSDREQQDEDEENFHIDFKRATVEFFRRLFTEFIGTMILTTVLGANLLESRLKLITSESAAFNNGLTILFLIYPLGAISGAHFNPVVTFTFTLRRVFILRC